MEFARKLDELMHEIDVEVGLGIPLMEDDHEMLRVVYRFNYCRNNNKIKGCT